MKFGNKLKIIVYAVLIGALFFYLKFRETNYYTIPTFAGEEIVFAVIEIPAGTNKKTEYNPETNKFVPDQIDNHDRIIQFLPYPFNYGFIPSTYMDPSIGGDGDALDICILSEAIEMKTVTKVLPIAMIQLIDNDEIDTKIIAIPTDDSKIIKAYSLKELQDNYPAVIENIEQWFLNYKGKGVIKIKSWQERNKAIAEIKKWQK
jgi:inorganic pyrophosphatase